MAQGARFRASIRSWDGREANQNPPLKREETKGMERNESETRGHKGSLRQGGRCVAKGRL